MDDMGSSNLETAKVNIRSINLRFRDNGYSIRAGLETGREADSTDQDIQGKARMKIVDENGFILQWLSPWISYKEMIYWTTAYSLGLGQGLMQ